MNNLWLFDEFTQTGTDYSDIKKVEIYDTKMSKFRDYKKESDIILNTLEVDTDQILLDIGTGTGHFALEAAKRCKKVYAIDVSSAMLEFAKLKAKKENINNIEFYNYGFLTFNFPDINFDCIVSNAALHHLPDLWKYTALNNIYKALKDKGRFLLGDVIFSFDINEIDIKINDWINGTKSIDKELYSEAIIHIKEEYSTFSWIIEGMLEKIGFNYSKINEINNFIAYLCVKDKKK